jgi:triosephosphate isomerase (TIM)
MRKQIAAANWKMNLTLQEGTALLQKIADADISLAQNQHAVFAVPFPYLQAMQQVIAGKSGFAVAAQNSAAQKAGAYTGEVSVNMLQSMQIPFVVLGHSERREYYNETNAILVNKINLALEAGLTPIFCCGEPLAIREAGTQNAFVEQQLVESLFHFSAEEIGKIVIAYEPIWAIGTGLTASSAQAQEMHAHIRSVFAAKYGDAVANQISILYGGSVKAANAQEIFSQPDVDGGLVGGASLIADEFIAIIKSLKS